MARPWDRLPECLQVLTCSWLSLRDLSCLRAVSKDWDALVTSTIPLLEEVETCGLSLPSAAQKCGALTALRIRNSVAATVSVPGALQLIQKNSGTLRKLTAPIWQRDLVPVLQACRGLQELDISCLSLSASDTKLLVSSCVSLRALTVCKVDFSVLFSSALPLRTVMTPATPLLKEHIPLLARHSQLEALGFAHSSELSGLLLLSALSALPSLSLLKTGCGIGFLFPLSPLPAAALEQPPVLSHLTTLEMSALPSWFPLLRAPNLKVLKLPERNPVLPGLLRRFPLLEEVTATSHSLHSEAETQECVAILKEGRAWRAMRSLNLSVPSCEAVAPLLPFLSGITELRLELECAFSEEDVSSALLALPSLRKLVLISPSGGGVSKEQKVFYPGHPSLSTKHESLRSLLCCSPRFGPAFFRCASLPALQELQVWQSHGSGNLAAFLPSSCPALTSLCLYSCPYLEFSVTCEKPLQALRNVSVCECPRVRKEDVQAATVAC